MIWITVVCAVMSSITKNVNQWRQPRKVRIATAVLESELKCAREEPRFKLNFDLQASINNWELTDKTKLYEEYYKIIDILQLTRSKQKNNVVVLDNIHCVVSNVRDHIPRNDFYDEMMEKLINSVEQANFEEIESIEMKDLLNSLKWFETCLVSFNMW